MGGTKGSTNTTPGGKTARPRLRWGGPPGTATPEVTSGQALIRGAGAVLALTNPVTAVLIAVAVLVMTRRVVMGRARGWWMAAAGGVVALATLRWTGPRYITPWVDVAGVVRANGPRSGSAIGRLAGEQWPAWLQGQLPLALVVAFTVGAVVLARRARHQAHWRTNDDDTRNLWSATPDAAGRVGTPGRAGRAGKKSKELAPAKAGTALPQMVMRLGHSPAGEPVTFTGAELMDHVAVVGPTGTGKTTTLMRLLHTFLVGWQAARCPVVVFDLKADPTVREALRGWAERTGRRFWHVSVTEDGAQYDALHAGSAEEVASRLVSMMSAARDGGFSEPHHRTVGERWLIASMLVLDDLAGQGRRHLSEDRAWERSLQDLATLMRPAVMERQKLEATGTAKARAEVLLEEIRTDKDLAKSMGGMRSRIALMAETAAGRVLSPSPGALRLEDAVRAGDVVLFGLAAASNAAATQVVGNLAIEDLAGIFDRLQHESWAQITGRRLFLVVDEFTGLGGEAMMKLYERARSGGGTLISSTQTSGGFRAVSEEFEASVWGNSGVWVLHKQEEGNDAEARAKGIGTERGWTETVQVHEDADVLGTTGGSTGVGSLRRTDHFRVHPNELKTLRKGCTVVWVKGGDRLERVMVDEVVGASTTRVLTTARPGRSQRLIQESTPPPSSPTVPPAPAGPSGPSGPTDTAGPDGAAVEPEGMPGPAATSATACSCNEDADRASWHEDGQDDHNDLGGQVEHDDWGPYPR